MIPLLKVYFESLILLVDDQVLAMSAYASDGSKLY
jgi:hypothetical protein